MMLHIFLENKFDVSQRVILKYISDLYSRCWDELVNQNKIKMRCVISCDSFDFLDRDIIIQSPNLMKAYLSVEHQPKEGGEIQGENCVSLTLKSLQAKLSSDDIKYFPLETSSQDQQIFYFDAGDDAPPSLSTLLRHENENPVPIYSRLAIGGTFDQLHNGHRKLLTLASALCDEVLTIGVITDALLAKKSNSKFIQPFHLRKEIIESFMTSLKPSLKLNIVELFDPYGPTITDPSFEGIVVSSETLIGAKMINKLRQERGFQKLAILVIKRSDISTLSSTFLRERDRIRENQC
jgi:cytidyltransferase-like protein